MSDTCVRVFLYLLAISILPITKVRSADFDRQIRPLLSDRCFQCHGPDQNQRQADLRLDTADFLKNEDAGLVVPGDPSQSELYRRITAADPDERMPPPEMKYRLTPAEISAVREWIAGGAVWQEHWAFSAPARQPLPQRAGNSSARSAVDSFVAAQLKKAGLPAAGEADRTTLIRRLTLDLTGLPPTPAELAAFVADTSPSAYEKLVDRLLASPRYGERMANAWLDAARFADTSGYQNDGPRSMWRWRDWVIDVYNAGMPFDQFTIQQIAGDLIPGATIEQRIATGFNRNHRGNSEGGIIPEEYQVEYVVDRVETTSTVWLALTMGCARCHDHKFDPFSQREFYRVYAFFNNLPENGRAIKEGNSPPYVLAPTPHQREQLERMDSELAALQQRFDASLPARDAVLRITYANLPPAPPVPTIASNLVARFGYDRVPGGKGLLDAHHFADGEAKYVPGRNGSAAHFDGQRFQDAGKVASFGYRDRFTLTAWVRPESAGGTILSKMVDEVQGAGYAVQLVDGQIQVNLVVRWLDDAIRVSTTARVPTDRWTHVAMAYDGSRLASGVHVYLDGELAELRVNLDAINQSFAKADQPLRIGAGGGPSARFHGAIDEVRVYDECLSPHDIAITATPAPPVQIGQRPAGERTPREWAKLRRHFLTHDASKDQRRVYERLVAAKRERSEFLRSLPTVMVMEEMERPRETFVLDRGQYDMPAERVTADVPSRLPALPAAVEEPTRLDFAKWLVADENPLTARVAVNRYWQQLFGQGLVRTTEDFGSQGERPTHPQLLDWLAVEFRENGWDGKGLQRKLVTSATYRRSSVVSPESLASDPDNRWLSRGPRYRLSAQTVRDQALAASGLLVERLGGPSVKPYQPADLWSDIATTQNYEQDTGANLYRRSLYTYWKRTVSPPAMVAFDASTRETCRVRVARTNTPLQALTLLNDVTFVEAARELAARVLAERQTSPTRLQLAFQRVLGRPPTDKELKILEASLASHLAHYRHRAHEAQQLVGIGDYPPSSNATDSELAAYTAVASMLLNLDEAVTKQ